MLPSSSAQEEGNLVTKDTGKAKLLSAFFALVSTGKVCSLASQFFTSGSKDLERTCYSW